MNTVFIKTPAKINLFLDVIAREDNGYHKIVTLFQTISLYDSLEITKSDAKTIILLLSSQLPYRPQIRHNIVKDVINKLHSLGYTRENFQIILTKQIPVGAGLGGGSSDAAATLIGINDLLNLNISDDDIEKILSTIGCDAPFFVKGGLQLGIHYGEMLDTINTAFKYYILLVYPGFQVSTKTAYKLLNKSLFRKGEKKLENIISAIDEKNLDKLICNLYNIFEEVVYKKYPELYAIKKHLIAEGAENALLSGTGSVVYGIYKDEEKAKEVFRRIVRLYKIVIPAMPVYTGVKIIKKI